MCTFRRVVGKGLDMLVVRIVGVCMCHSSGCIGLLYGLGHSVGSGYTGVCIWVMGVLLEAGGLGCVGSVVGGLVIEIVGGLPGCVLWVVVVVGIRVYSVVVVLLGGWAQSLAVGLGQPRRDRCRPCGCRVENMGGCMP